MKFIALIMSLLALAACEASTASKPLSTSQAQGEPSQPGIRISGYARVGGSHRF